MSFSFVSTEEENYWPDEAGWTHEVQILRGHDKPLGFGMESALAFEEENSKPFSFKTSCALNSFLIFLLQ